MRNTLIGTLALGACLFGAPRLAEAKLVEIWGSGLIGGATGNGKTNRDFYNWAGGGAAGVEVGARVLFIGAYVDYLRFFGGDTGANLVGFNLGGDGEIGLMGKLSLVFRLAGAFYLGSLDRAGPRGASAEARTEHVQTRGVGVRGGVGLRYSFAKIFSIGTTPQVGYHYFFGGADEDLTDVDQNSSGWDFQFMGYLRASLGI